MGFPFDFLTPQQQAGQQDVGNNVATFMGNPGIQAALLSAGLQAMQPPSFGDTGASQIARAIGAGGQSAAAMHKSEQADTELASKQDLRSAQADAAQARADTATTRTNAASDRLQYMRERDTAARQLQSLSLQIKLSNAYQMAKAKIDKANTDRALLGQPPLPIPTFDEFVATNPQLKTLYGGDTGGTTTPPVTSSATSTSSADAIAQAKDAIARGANPEAVKNKLRSMGIDPSGL